MRDAKGRFIKGHKENLGSKRTEETRKKISEANKGRVSSRKGTKLSGEWLKNIRLSAKKRRTYVFRECEVCQKKFKVSKCREKTARFCSCKCRAKVIMAVNHAKGRVPWNKGLKNWSDKAGFQKGEKNPAWNGGISTERDKDRRKLKEWTQKVFKRDNYICQKTGIRGRKLNAHHIEDYSNNPKLRFDIKNGITFLEYFHRWFHRIYGYKNNKKQLEEFLKL